jgi:ATP-binding protein involved in chromosome partitioning
VASEAAAAAQEKMPGIKHVVAVASGKGGVGKSTVSVNLALALQREGSKVGIVDADILGPSVPTMLGVPKGVPPAMIGAQAEPVERHGVKVMSMAMLTGDDEPAILRGPMVSRYLQMFIGGVVWGELDYLIIDLPPGTGDIQLSLAQSTPLSGVVIVTTPQDVSLNIARRGLRMFEKVNVPILGIVENMSAFACPHCGEETPVFSQGGGARMAEELGVPFLGAIPLDPAVVAGGDRGEPIVTADPDSPVSVAYHGVASSLGESLEAGTSSGLGPFHWHWADDQGEPPWIPAAAGGGEAAREVPAGMRKQGDRTLGILWGDGARQDYDVRDLRLLCPCASCVDEGTGERVLKPEMVPEDIAPVEVFTVGTYAVCVKWSDGHDSGIFSFELLRRLGDQQAGGAFSV